MNYYIPTIQSWRGANVNTLTRYWGLPHCKIITQNGNFIYTYITANYRNYMLPSNLEVGINRIPGGPRVIITNSKYPWGRALSLCCIAGFELNKQGVIVNTQIQGNSCYGSKNFAITMANPAVNIVKSPPG
jgi:hypothetical protein